MSEVLDCFEQRDDLDLGCRPTRHRGLGERVHVGDVDRITGEADDVAPARGKPESVLDLLDGAKGREHLLGLGGPPASAIDLADCGIVNLAVLAHLELREVEAERFDLPDEALDLALPETSGPRAA